MSVEFTGSGLAISVRPLPPKRGDYDDSRFDIFDFWCFDRGVSGITRGVDQHFFHCAGDQYPERFVDDKNG